MSFCVHEVLGLSIMLTLPKRLVNIHLHIYILLQTINVEFIIIVDQEDFNKIYYFNNNNNKNNKTTQDRAITLRNKALFCGNRDFICCFRSGVDEAS